MPVYNFSSGNQNNTEYFLNILNKVKQECITSNASRSNMVGLILREASEDQKMNKCNLDLKEIDNFLTVHATCQLTYASWKYKIALPKDTWKNSTSNWVEL